MVEHTITCNAELSKIVRTTIDSITPDEAKEYTEEILRDQFDLVKVSNFKLFSQEVLDEVFAQTAPKAGG